MVYLFILFYLHILLFVMRIQDWYKVTVKLYTNYTITSTFTILPNGPMTKISYMYNQYKIPT
jgi:hypothetical protein